MRVVSDPSPLSYLVLIECAWVLPRLFGEVTIPQAVLDELRHAESPESLRRWIKAPPPWLRVEAVVPPASADPALARLHDGERETIVPAGQIGAGLVIVDERAARAEVARRKMPLTGLLGVIDSFASEWRAVFGHESFVTGHS